jgi:hypothetical protein
LVDGVPSDEIDPGVLQRFLDSTKETLQTKIKKTSDEPREFTLRFSNIGHPCVRKLWLEKNYPLEKIPFRPETLLKFAFGDLTEEYILFLAELAGHKIEHRQATVKTNGIVGHIDVVIDGELVDVKSASKYSFEKFKAGLTPDVDSFGYIPQLLSYLDALKDTGYCRPDRAHFLVFDKERGHLHLDTHTVQEEHDWPEFFEKRKAVVNGPDMPDRTFDPVPEGKSGNMKLGVNCSYCDFKKKCHPGLRTFIYSNGPVYLTTVAREPNVYEAKE